MAKIALRSYNEEISGLIETGQIDEAIGHCRHILQFFSKYVEVYRLLGKAYLEEQRYGDAADVLQRVLSATPDDFIAHIGMSMIREDEGNMDASIYHMERAFESSPSNQALQGELRRLYTARDGVEPTKVRLTRGALARMYAHGNLHEQSLAEVLAALRDDPKRLDLHVVLAQMYYETERYPEAVEACNQILNKLPYCIDANRLLATILIKTDRVEDAEVFLENWMALDPYAEHLDETTRISENVAAELIMVDKLEWSGSLQPAGEPQPAWASSLGVEVESGAESSSEPLPDWMGDASSSDSGGIDLGSLSSEDEGGTFGEANDLLPAFDAEEDLDFDTLDAPDWLAQATGGLDEGALPDSGNAILNQVNDGTPGETPNDDNSDLLAKSTGSLEEGAGAGFDFDKDSPDWLLKATGSLDEGLIGSGVDPTNEIFGDDSDNMPGWLSKATGALSRDALKEEGDEGAPDVEVPSWLARATGTLNRSALKDDTLSESLPKKAPDEEPAEPETPEEQAASEEANTLAALFQNHERLTGGLPPLDEVTNDSEVPSLDSGSGLEMPSDGVGTDPGSLPVEPESTAGGDELADFLAEGSEPAAPADDGIDHSMDWLDDAGGEILEEGTDTPPAEAEPASGVDELADFLAEGSEPTIPADDGTPPAGGEILAGGTEAPTAETELASGVDELADFLAEGSEPAAPADDGIDHSMDWLDDAGGEIPTAEVEPASGVDELADFLAQGDEAAAPAESSAGSEEEIPDFLKDAGWGDSTEPEQPTSMFEGEDDEPTNAVPTEDMPDWVKDMAPDESGDDGINANQGLDGSSLAAAAPPVEIDPEDDWLKDMNDQNDTPDWLDDLGSPEGSGDTPPPAADPAPAGGDPANEMGEDDGMAWLEGLAANQGVSEDELTTSEEAREAAPPAEAAPERLADEGADELAAFLAQGNADEVPTPEPATEDTGLDFLDNLDDGTVSAAKAPPIPGDDATPASADPAGGEDDGMAWLESLAANQGASEDELTTSEDARDAAPPAPPEELPPEPAGEEVDELAAFLAQDDSDGDTGLDFLNNLDDGTVSAAKAPPIPGDDATPASADPAGGEDDGMAWLESLAANQGASEDELTTSEDARDVAPPAPPEELSPEPADEEVDELAAFLAQDDSDGDTGLDFLDNLDDGTVSAAKAPPIPGDDAAPASTDPAGGEDDGMAWLESLAANQGASEDELTTSEDARDATPPAPLEELSPEPATESTGLDFLDNLDDGTVSATKAPPIPGDDAAPASTDPAAGEDDGMAWLESLAANQGVSEDELTTSEDAREAAPPAPPEELSPEPAGEEVDELAAFLAQGNADEVPTPEPATEGTGLDFLDNLDDGTVSAAKAPPLPGDDAAPASADPAAGEDDGMAWLESLAANQGASEDELTTSEDARDVAPPAPPEELSPEPATEGTSLDFLDNLDDGTVSAAKAPPIPGDDAAPASTDPTGGEDDGMAWLESLAANQGASEDELTTEENARSAAPPPAATEASSDEAPATSANEPKDGSTVWLESAKDEKAQETAAAVEELTTTPLEEISPAPEVAPVVEDTPGEETPELEADDSMAWLTDTGDAGTDNANKEDDTDQFLQSLETKADPAPAPKKPAESSSLPDWLQADASGQESVDDSEPPEWIPDVEEVSATTPEDWQPKDKDEKKPVAKPKTKPKTKAKPKPKPKPAITADIIDARKVLASEDLSAAAEAYTRLVKKGKDVEQVVQDLNDALKKYPINPELWQTLGDAYTRLDMLQEAMDAFTKSEDLLR